MADSEALAAFSELQKTYSRASSALKEVALAGRGREQERQRLLLTMSELEPLPDGATLYRGLGRASVPGGPAATAHTPLSHASRIYVQAESKAVVLSDLRTGVEAIEEELQGLMTRKQTLEREAISAEAGLKELLAANESLLRSVTRQ